MIKKLYENLKVKLGRNSLDPSALIGIMKDYPIDTGSDQYGTWTKMNSGELIYQLNTLVNYPCTTDYGSSFRTEAITLYTEAPFVSTPHLTNAILNGLAYATLNSVGINWISVFGVASQKTRTVTRLALELKGRWK